LKIILKTLGKIFEKNLKIFRFEEFKKIQINFRAERF
jgi:hypothetical protein